MKLKDKIVHRRNFSEHWVVGEDSVRTSDIRDHSHADRTGPDARWDQLDPSLHIAYVVTQADSPATLCSICSEVYHNGVTVGTAYTNEIAGRTFAHYTAEAKRQGNLLVPSTFPVKWMGVQTVVTEKMSCLVKRGKGFVVS